MVVFSQILELVTLEVFFILNDSIILLNPNFSLSAIYISCSLLVFFLVSVIVLFRKVQKEGWTFLPLLDRSS